ncbi:MAG: DUF5615 family PIN-like protein [Chloroflexi bacterium]|nr:DUF5615 family PIN-like protein [Chloroflexota bacterium]
MRFYLDEDLPAKVAVLARGRDVDVVSSHELGHDGYTDEQQLLFAAAEGRCLVTRNRDHFIALTVSFFEQGQPHAGLLIVPTTSRLVRPADLATALVAYGGQHPAGLHPYTIDYLRSAPNG